MTIQEIVDILVKKRNLQLKVEDPVKISSPFDSNQSIEVLKKHIDLNNKIAIYGDYDVDGICSTAIIWETIYSFYKNVFPHIPHRESEGYGLSKTGIDQCINEGAKLIIAVDNGIVAYEQIEYCVGKGLDIIVIDHHEPGEQLPNPTALVHTLVCCAAAMSWFWSRDLRQSLGLPANREHLGLAAMGTICDMMPLVGVNRSLAKFGLVELNHTPRIGIKQLLNLAGLADKKIGTYEVGFVIGPRINSMGRLEHAIDSLRLICTKDPARAIELASLLQDTNKKRQEQTEVSIKNAKQAFQDTILPNIILSADSEFHPGVIGLIASKLLEEFSRPSLVVSIGPELSKGSGRSVAGFHITDFLRTRNDLFVALGGHAGACGFTIATEKLAELDAFLQTAQIDSALFAKNQRVDLEIPLELANMDLWMALSELEPFGLGNPQPIFKSSATIVETRPLGQTQKHLALKFSDAVEGIWFNAGKINLGPVEVVYALDKNEWNGKTRMQLVVKSVHEHRSAGTSS